MRLCFPVPPDLAATSNAAKAAKQKEALKRYNEAYDAWVKLYGFVYYKCYNRLLLSGSLHGSKDGDEPLRRDERSSERSGSELEVKEDRGHSVNLSIEPAGTGGVRANQEKGGFMEL